MATCLITGASGFLGREVSRRLATRYSPLGVAFRHGADMPALDLRDSDALASFLRQHRPDAVVHLAAYRDPDFCEEHREETWALNVRPLEVFCNELPPHVPLLFVSTDYVFDGRRPPYREADPVCPINVYGESKAVAERIVAQRPGATILRVPLLVGAATTLETSGFIAQMWQTVRDKTPRLEDHVIVRFPTWIRDVAAGIAFLLEGNHSGCFHLSSLRGATRYEWMREFAEIVGESADHLSPSSEVVPRRAERPLNSQLCSDRLLQLGFEGPSDFRAVVRDVLTSFSVPLP